MSVVYLPAIGSFKTLYVHDMEDQREPSDHGMHHVERQRSVHGKTIIKDIVCDFECFDQYSQCAFVEFTHHIVDSESHDEHRRSSRAKP